MKLFIIITISIVFFIIYWICFRSKRDYIVGKYMFYFERIYDSILIESGSKKLALNEALKVFHDCPCLRELTIKDLYKIVIIVGDTPDPKRVIMKTLMVLDAEKALITLRDEKLLHEIAAIYKREYIPLKGTAEAFKQNTLQEVCVFRSIRHPITILSGTSLRFYPALCNRSEATLFKNLKGAGWYPQNSSF